MAALHPQAQAFLDKAAAFPRVYEITPEDARAQSRAGRAAVPDGPPVAEVEDHPVAVEGGEIVVRRYRPAAAEPLGTIAYFHGGGWIMGDLEVADPSCRALAVASGCELFSVDYRLAPEHRFPVPVRDAEAALAWIVAREPARGLVLCGDSSGGTLAAVLARHARDAGAPDVALQILIYPVVDTDATRPSYAEHGDAGLLLGSREMAYFWDLYADAGERADPDAAPMHAADLHGVAPALVIVAEHDPLRDEVLAYAGRLTDAGVPTEVLRFDDMHHGFWGRPGVFDRADEAIAAAGERVRRVLA